MPTPTLDQLKQREGALSSKLAKQGEGLDPNKRRALRKKLRRTQRRRRRLSAHIARHAPKPAEPSKSAPGGEAKPEASDPQ